MVAGLKAMGASVLLLPERLEIVNELPKTSVGKIDKKALQKNIRDKVERESADKGQTTSLGRPSAVAD